MKPYFQNEHGSLYNCDVLDGLKSLPDNSVDLIVTSPPYWGLRDYGVDGQIGLEADFQTFLCKLVEIFTECYRVLKPSGNLYVNMGDSYSAGGGDRKPNQQGHNSCVGGSVDANAPKKRARFGLPAKNLIGQPWRLAFALQGFAVMPFSTILEYADLLKEARKCEDWEIVSIVENRLRLWAFTEALSKNYILREEIIWDKISGMPESVNDRCTRAHEYIFHFTKQSKYQFQQMLEPIVSFDKIIRDRENTKLNNTPGRTKMRGLVRNDYDVKNKRSVWRVSMKPFSGAHFATFPPDLIAPIIQAACPLGGTVLDIFGGSGTSAYVAEQFQRKWLLFELNPKYCNIAVKRIQGVAIEDTAPMLDGEKLITIEDFLEVQG